MKKIIAAILLTLILIGFSFFNPSEEKGETIKQVANQTTPKSSTPLSNKQGEEPVPSINMVNKKVDAIVAGQRKVEPLQAEQEKLPINRVKEVVEDNTLAVVETEIIPQDKASDRQTRLSLIRTTFKYPLLILKETGDFSDPEEEKIESVEAQVAGHFIVRFFTFSSKRNSPRKT
jgi:hypothetical protein